ncbi:uncharacterized protein [Epargyreus clarus]
MQIQKLQNELSTLRDRDVVDFRSEADEELNRLREENKNLTTNLEDLDNQHQMAMDRLLTLKNELHKNFDVLKQEHEDLKSANDGYANEVQVLLTKIGERDKEIEKMKSVHVDYDTLMHKYQNLERIHSLLRENAEKFQEENQDLHEEVFKLQEQVTKLEHDFEIATKRNEMSDVVPKAKYDEILKELNLLKDRRNSNQIHLDEINIDDNAKGVIETLKRDIHELRHKLSERESNTHDNNDNKIVKSDRIMQLYNKYVNFDLPVDYVGEMPSATDNVALYKLECIFKTFNSFKKEIDTLDQKLSEKTLDFNHLQTQLEDLTTENDFLTTDLQHYERELDEMKKNNDFLISEIAALKNTSKLEPIIETHEDNFATLETELADSNMMNKTFESKIQRIEKELIEVNKEKAILQDSLNDMRKKYTSLLNELEMCKMQTKSVEELENNTTKKQSEKISNEIDDLKKRLSSANSKNEQLSIDIHILENDKVLLTKEVDDLKNALEAKLNSYKELRSSKDILEQELIDLQRRLQEVDKSRQEMESSKTLLEDKMRHLESEIPSNTDLEKVVTEKNKISEKLDQSLKEKSDFMNKIHQLTKDIEALRIREQELINENKSIIQNSTTESQQTSALQQTIEQLKEKISQLDIANGQIPSLKAENERLVESELRLKAELITTDTKITQLEEDFEKLIADLNEKDTMIDNLNKTINEDNEKIVNLSQNVTDLENAVTIKTKELDHLKHSLEEVTEQLRSHSHSSNQSQEELNRLHIEKEEISKHIYQLNDELNSKNIEISRLTNHSDELQNLCSQYQSNIETKNKEVEDLKQSVADLTNKLTAANNITHHNEKAEIDKSVIQLQNDVAAKDAELLDAKSKLDFLEHTCAEYKNLLDTATVEKNDLINLITLKHNESIQYHNEIQRLNQVLMEQTNEFKKIIAEKDAAQNSSSNCQNCEKLSIALKEKDEKIMSLNQNMNDQETLRAELQKSSEIIRNLTKKCEDLDKSLTIQLETVKKLTAENVQLSEQEQNSSRELERLRHHLVEMEESYTQELMTSEQKLSECQVRLHQVEERAKQTSTVYTSNSIRANQEVETLRNQIKLLEKQREEVQTRLSDAEDARSRSEAAMTNLQVVLEQFQLDKERDIHNATEKIRNQMQSIKQDNDNLRLEIGKLNAKLEESKAGLQAATRLGDQVETKTAQINDLKEQVRTLQTSVAAAEERYYNAISNQQDKVDKNLVKNLVINYVTTAGQSNVNRVQVLRVLSTVLDFNQTECERLGLSRTTQPDSLAAEFVKFLQNESRPRATPPLPTLHPAPSRKSSTVGPPIFELGHRRNPSTGSNNLLFQNLEALETASQKSTESESRVIPVGMDTGVNQTRNNEGSILKHVLKDM